MKWLLPQRWGSWHTWLWRLSLHPTVCCWTSYDPFGLFSWQSVSPKTNHTLPRTPEFSAWERTEKPTKAPWWKRPCLVCVPGVWAAWLEAQVTWVTQSRVLSLDKEKINLGGFDQTKKLSFGCSVSKERKQRLGSDSKLVEKETWRGLFTPASWPRLL